MLKRRTFLAIFCVVVSAVVALWAGFSPASAATFTVTKTADTNDGSCNADCSLREAIIAANAAGGTNTIDLPAGTYTLTLAGGDEDASATGDLDITHGSLTISGHGSDTTIIDGGGIDRVFQIIGSSTHVTIHDVTIRNGNLPTGKSGGGILNNGVLTLNSVIVSGNTVNGTASTDVGGGIDNGSGPGIGTLTITNSMISGNRADRGGGLFHTGSGTLTITDSTISGNTARAGGAMVSFGPALIVNSTISGNTGSSNNGGIINDNAILTLINVTISGNSSRPGFGDGIFNTDNSSAALTNVTIIGNAGTGIDNGETAVVTLRNTIIAGNAESCNGTIVSAGHNLSSDSSCNFTGTGDLNNADPRLGPLAFNGGPTLTHALLSGSPAIDAADPAQFPSTDQRGVSRPQLGGPDMGAFELTPIFPTEGTLGTEILVSGRGFGEKKGKVLLGTVSLKVLEWTDKFIRGLVTKAPLPGSYTVAVQPKGTLMITMAGNFEVEAPQIERIDPDHGASGGEVTIEGKFFGTKKGKVTLGGKNSKVLSWTMDSLTGESNIQFVIPKGLGPGSHELKVINTVGEDTISFTVE